MAIFVTGGAGYIGSHTIVELIRQGYAVVAADNFVNSKPGVIERVKKITGAKFPFYDADVRDLGALDKIFSENEIESVIHFAGLKAVGESVSVPLAYYGNNLNTTIALCETMEKFGVKRIIFSSSATVYSGGNEMPLTEGSAVGDCSSPYGWTKFMCEQILRDQAAAQGDWSVVLLRYFNPIGAHESGEIGEDPQGIPNNLLPFITQTAAGKRGVLSVYGDDYPTPDGTCIRDYIHISDLAAGHVAALRYAESNVGTEAFNLGTGKGTSVFEMIAAFEGATGVVVPKKIAGRRAGDLPVSYAGIDKARETLGWTAEKNVGDGCRDSWKWQKYAETIE